MNDYLFQDKYLSYFNPKIPSVKAKFFENTHFYVGKSTF